MGRLFLNVTSFPLPSLQPWGSMMMFRGIELPCLLVKNFVVNINTENISKCSKWSDIPVKFPAFDYNEYASRVIEIDSDDEETNWFKKKCKIYKCTDFFLKCFFGLQNVCKSLTHMVDAKENCILLPNCLICFISDWNSIKYQLIYLKLIDKLFNWLKKLLSITIDLRNWTHKLLVLQLLFFTLKSYRKVNYFKKENYSVDLMSWCSIF